MIVRECGIRLHVRMTSCEDGYIQYVQNILSTYTDTISRSDEYPYVSNFHYSFSPYKYPEIHGTGAVTNLPLPETISEEDSSGTNEKQTTANPGTAVDKVLAN